MRMNFNIKFHPVGFGLFTSGKIGKFKFVYDCGSTKTTNANKCVEEEFEEGEHLDFLAISHFHKDHISGLKRLLEVVDHVETIILPYITPRERLYYFLTLEMNDPDFDWISDFIINPADFLLSPIFKEKITNIVFIKGGAEKYFDENRNENTEDPDLENENLDFDINNLESVDDERNIKSNEGIDDPRVLIKKHGSVPLTSGKIKIWQFIFYYCAQSENVDKYLKEIAGIFNFNSDSITKDDLKSIINDAKFPQITKGHDVSNSDINNTSLLLYHSPIKFKNGVLLKGYVRRIRIDYFLINNNFGHLYTGDVNLYQKHAEVSQYYGSLIKDTSVFQVPHHGSIDNWQEIISVNNPGMLHIISSKFNNSRGLHPNPEVLYQILKHQGIVLWCNENREVVLYGGIWYR